MTGIISFNSKVQINSNLKRKLENKIAKTQLLLDSKIVSDMSPYTPFRTGALDKSAYIGLGSGIISNKVLYARTQYYGIGFDYTKVHHPQATHHWFEKAKAINRPIWNNLVQIELKKPDATI